MSKISYKLLRQPTDDDKVAKTPQVKVIIGNLGAVGSVIQRDELFEILDADENFKSKQGADKVVNFYVPKLVEAGIIEKLVEETTDEDQPKVQKAKTEKKKAPAKSKKKGEVEPTMADEEEDLSQEAA